MGQGFHELREQEKAQHNKRELGLVPLSLVLEVCASLSWSHPKPSASGSSVDGWDRKTPNVHLIARSQKQGSGEIYLGIQELLCLIKSHSYEGREESCLRCCGSLGGT